MKLIGQKNRINPKRVEYLMETKILIGVWNFPLRMLWDTRNITEGSTPENQIKIPVTNAMFSPLTIEWGDGSWNNIISPTDPNLIHEYEVSGQYEVSITGSTLGFAFSGIGDRNKLLRILDWGGLQLLLSGFQGCENLKLDEVVGTPQGLRNLRSTFKDCKSIDRITELELWDVSKVINMTQLFQGTKLTQDISQWNFNPNVILEGIMDGNTSENYQPEFYDALLKKLSRVLVGKGRSQLNKQLGMGTIKHTEAGQTYKNILINDGWTITDGGVI